MGIRAAGKVIGKSQEIEVIFLAIIIIIEGGEVSPGINLMEHASTRIIIITVIGVPQEGEVGQEIGASHAAEIIAVEGVTPRILREEIETIIGIGAVALMEEIDNQP